MSNGLFLGSAEQRVEMNGIYERRVILEGIKLGDISGDPRIKASIVDKGGSVPDNRANVLIISLIASKLFLAKFGSGDDDRLQPDTILHDKHIGVELQLPLRIHHLRRNDNLKSQIDLSMTLGHISETGRDHGGVQDFVGHGFAGLFILDGVHKNKFLAVKVNLDGITLFLLDDSTLFHNLVAGKRELGGIFFRLELLKFRRTASHNGARQQASDESDYYSCFGFHLHTISEQFSTL